MDEGATHRIGGGNEAQAGHLGSAGSTLQLLALLLPKSATSKSAMAISDHDSRVGSSSSGASREGGRRVWAGQIVCPGFAIWVRGAVVVRECGEKKWGLYRPSLNLRGRSPHSVAPTHVFQKSVVAVLEGETIGSDRLVLVYVFS